jgi:hypothetical protein
MDTNQLFATLIRSLKAAIDAGAMYFFDHPIFQESAERLCTAIRDIMQVTSPVRIGFTPSSLMYGDTLYEDQLVYKTLAHNFHIKKIKTLTFHEGISGEELKEFLILIALTPKELLKNGGIQKLVDEKNLPHIKIEEIDYTELLYAEGEECDDVWTYLLSEAVTKNNQDAISKYTQNFEALMRRFKVHTVVADEEASKNLEKFMTYLQQNEESAYKDCAKHILRNAMKDKEISSESNLSQLNIFTQNLGTEELADTLWEEILSEDSVDELNLSLFSQLLDPEKNEQVASSLQAKMDKNKILLQAPRVRNRIKDLFSSEKSSMIPKSYHHFLTTALANISSAGTVKYDKNHATKNYWYTLASILGHTKDASHTEKILDRIESALSSMQKECPILFFLDLHSTMTSLQMLRPESKTATRLGELMYVIEKHVNDLIYEGNALLSEFDEIANKIGNEKPTIERFYNQFFNESKVNPFMLRLLLFLAGATHEIFYYHIEQKSRDLNFIRKVIDIAKALPLTDAEELLTKIYYFSGRFIQVKVLQEMHALGIYNPEVIKPILHKAPLPVKLEAMKVALKDEAACTEALSILFSVSSFLGIKNHILRMNIKIVDDLNVHQAKPYIEKLAHQKFLWKRSVQKEAARVLEKWNDQ